MDKIDFRVLIKHYYLRRKSIMETKKKLDKYYGDIAPSTVMIKKWFTQFLLGNASCRPKTPQRRAAEFFPPEIIYKIHTMMLSDANMKAREMAKIVGIPIARVKQILKEFSDLNKLQARWQDSPTTTDRKALLTPPISTTPVTSTPTGRKRKHDTSLSGTGTPTVDGRHMCDVCHLEGTAQNLVRCDECRKNYHFTCLDPPLKKTPKKRGYSWHCADCDPTDRESN